MPLKLKVTSIERYHLCDDTDQNPNVIGCELTVSGEVDPDIATLALRDTARRHPLICARLKDGKHWVYDLATDIERLAWHGIAEDPQEDLRRIDPIDQFAARFLMLRRDNLTVLSFRTHHALMDGGGGLQLVADWLATYHRISSGTTKPASRKTNPEILPQRNNLRLLNRRFLSKLWIQPIAMLGATKFLFRRVSGIDAGSDSTADNLPPNDFHVITQTISSESVAELRAAANSTEATVNDLILRAVFLSLHEFRQLQENHQPDEWLRLVIPISIRDFADRRLPAANRATLVQLDRTDRDFADPAGLLWGINYELGNIRNWNLEKTFLLVMRCLSVIPGFLSRSAKKDVCRATSVVTNLGAPFERLKLERIDGKLRSGGLIIEDVGLIVPLRKHTPIGLAVIRYAGQLKLCLHYDPVQLNEKHARQVLQMVNLRLTTPEDTADH